MDVTRISACSIPLRNRGLDEAFRVIAESGFDKIDLLGRMPHFSVTDPGLRPGRLGPGVR